MDLRKKKRFQKESEIDRIGELPDPLLIHILSLLDNTKDAVKTGLLSKRWLNLWTNLDSLVFNFDIENPSKRLLGRFMLDVDKTLIKCTCPKIKKFCLTGSGFYHVESYSILQLVQDWVHFLVEKNVEEFKLGLKGLDYEVPDSFYRNSSLVTLEIDNVGRRECPDGTCSRAECASLVSLRRYHGKTDVSWNKLKRLSLKCVYVKNKFLADVLLGCPVLETMVLDAVRGLNVIDITSPSVRELKVISFTSHTGYVLTLDITAPGVKKLELLGCFDEIECQLVNVSSLKTARLTLNYTMCLVNWMPEDDSEDDSEYDSSEDEEHYSHRHLWFNIVNGLLKPVCNVEELVIGAELLTALSLSKVSNGDSLMFSCKHVTLESAICVHEAPGIVELLECSPYLETLVINLMPFQSHETQLSCYTYFMEKVFSKQKGTFPCLKSVTIDCSGKPCCGREIESSANGCFCYELKVAEHIIRNSPVLENVEISSDCSYCAERYLKLVSWLPNTKLEINLQDGTS